MQSLKILFIGSICTFGAAFGALQCFAPAKLRELQKRYRAKADWRDSAGGRWIEHYADRQARNPTVMYRLGGLLLMLFFLFGLFRIARLLH